MSENDKKIKELDELFTRGVGEFIDPNGSFRNKLKNNPKEINIKFGVDPTRPDIHLGHAVVLHKVRQLQDLGCKVIFLIGDVTAQIGDPTGKSKIRPEISLSEIQKNMNTYLEQVGNILSVNPEVFEWAVNSDWFVSVNDVEPPTQSINIEGITTPELPPTHILNKAAYWFDTRFKKKNNQSLNYSLLNVLAVLRKISHGRLIERDMFQERIKKGEPIFMHEMMYPVLQGIDSKAIHDIYGTCDLEVGGTDQHFNMLVGREVMEMNKLEPQAVLSFKILTGLDGKDKMSKSLDNYIGITDEPNDMYGKVMSIPDSLIEHYFELCTTAPMEQIKEISEKLKNESINPKDIKMDLARQITAIYHGQEKAKEAQESWEATFSKKEIPDDVPEYAVAPDANLIDIFVENKIVSSKGDFRRLVEEGAITNLSTDTKINNTNTKAQEGVYRIGKKRFCKISFK